MRPARDTNPRIKNTDSKASDQHRAISFDAEEQGTFLDTRLKTINEKKEVETN